LFFYFFFFFLVINKKEDQYQPLNNFKDNYYNSGEISIQIKKGFFSKIYVGNIVYNKKNGLNLKVNSNSDFLELGFNKDFFWYFSSNERIFYYGKVSDSSFVLKEIFNPKNLSEILQPEENSMIYGNYGTFLKKQIDFKNKNIYKVYLYDNIDLVYSIEYKKYLGPLPIEMEVYYKKENVLIKIFIYNLKQLDQYDFYFPIEDYEKVEILSP
jgi:hypothetical protein